MTARNSSGLPPALPLLQLTTTIIISCYIVHCNNYLTTNKKSISTSNMHHYHSMFVLLTLHHHHDHQPQHSLTITITITTTGNEQKLGGARTTCPRLCDQYPSRQTHTHRPTHTQTAKPRWSPWNDTPTPYPRHFTRNGKDKN